MMQRERAAGQQPRHDRGGEACERAERERAEDRRLRLDTRFEMHRKAARDQLGMAARDRHDAFGRDIEGHECDMIRRLAEALDVRVQAVACENIVERRDTIRQVVAETRTGSGW